MVLLCGAIYQHCFFAGPFGLLVSAAFWAKNDRRARGWRLCWGGMFDLLGRSMIAVGIFWLFLYLMFMPSLIQTYEDQYQYTMSFVRNPGKYAELLEKTVEEVKKDWSWMNEPQPQNQELQ